MDRLVSSRPLTHCAALALLLVFLSHTGAATAASIEWIDLDAATHALLEPWQESWSRISVEDRQRLLANASQWQAMSEPERAAFLRRNIVWNALPPLQRAQRRERYAAWHALPPDDKVRVRAAALRFSALPAAEQQSRRAQFAALDADSQRSWLLGPTSGGWIASVLPLFAYTPDGERAPTLAMLLALPVEAHAPLLQLAQRLPEKQRESLRRDLLATAAAARLRFLQQRLAQ
jgi:hypothetical protein